MTMRKKRKSIQTRVAEFIAAELAKDDRAFRIADLYYTTSCCTEHVARHFDTNRTRVLRAISKFSKDMVTDAPTPKTARR